MGVLNQTPTLIHQLVGFLNLTRVWRGSLDGKMGWRGQGRQGKRGRMVSDWGAGVSNDGGGRVVSDRGGWLGAGRVVGGGWCGRARGGMGGR